MPQIDFQQVFLHSASEVLETMFFTGVAGEEANEEPGRTISAKLKFDGNASGEFGIRVPVSTAMAIARNFLGLDEASDRQAAEVTCELSNMLCGSVLSRIDANGRYALEHPEIDHENSRWQERDAAVGYTFRTDEGTVTLWMSIVSPEPAYYVR